MTVANQIAAGEVIERPASVVKELLENALDAGATQIHIDIAQGGLSQIKISDNGVGIMADDLPLAIAAHATSKMSQLQDLYAIKSMGFRGEALASIAAISRLAISSKPASQSHAMMIQIEGNTTPRIVPTARAMGTTVEVRDLFFNAPVRKKFLKSVSCEYQLIEAVVKRFALSEPTISLNLTHQGKPMLTLAGAACDKTRLLRIKKLLGKLFIEHAVYLDVEQTGLHLQGWVTDKGYQRSQNDKQWIYVNQRMMKDKLINHAIKQAYDDLLYPGRYPACLLYLTVDGDAVDVNVHPSKHEVRFQQPRLVHDFMMTHIGEALGRPSSMEEVVKPQSSVKASRIIDEYTPPQHAFMFRQATLSAAATWFIVNAHFALLACKEHTYLVDVLQAQQHYLRALLKKEPRPFSSRPLLLPLNYSFASMDKLDAYQEVLASVGIQMNRISDKEVVIRSLPVLLPQLNIKAFLEALLSLVSYTDDVDLIDLLLRHTTFNTSLLSDDDKDQLYGYIHPQLDANKTLPWCLCLDLATCHSLLRGTFSVAI